MSITTDWHIHTRNSCDCPNGISMEKLVKQAGEQGITDFGGRNTMSCSLSSPSSRADSISV